MLLNHRYQVNQVLAEGGFGKTFLAEDTHLPSHRPCVIKQLKPIAAPDEYQLVQERFQREAAILERLGESNDQIPKLYAYFIEAEQFYLVQELIDGKTLMQTLGEQGPLNEYQVRTLLLSLLTVLTFVHSQKIVHRDIKPENIIIRRSDQKPVLIDFGVVKEVLQLDSAGNPTSSIIAGTRGYMALEQAAGKPLFVSDLYSLGVTAIVLLTGKSPRELTDLSTGEIRWHEYGPNVSSGLRVVLDKATQVLAENRYLSAMMMKAAIQNLGKEDEESQERMVSIPAGVLNSSEGRINIERFFLDIHEVTVREYGVFLEATGHAPPPKWPQQVISPQRPVVFVSWHDAKVYANWAGKRLPTEAEWEYAARGGISGKPYPWGHEPAHGRGNFGNTNSFIIWYQANKYLMNVGRFEPNGYGLYDMAGNVWEWCEDQFVDKDNPSNHERVVRGGAWCTSAEFLQCDARTAHTQSFRNSDVGFRCARNA